MEQPQLDNRPQPLQNEAVAEGARDGLRFKAEPGSEEQAGPSNQYPKQEAGQEKASSQEPAVNGASDYQGPGGQMRSYRPPAQVPHSQSAGQMRSLNESVSPSSTETSHYAARPLQMPMAESRQEEEFLMHLASQGGGHGLGGAQARPSMMPRGQDGMAAMNMARGGMMPRPLYPEDELAGGMYGPGSGEPMLRDPSGRYTRMAAPPMQADMRHGGHAAMGSPSARSLAPNAHMQGHPSDGSPVLGHEDFRDPSRMSAASIAPAASLQRSASEGLMRTPGGAGHIRTRSSNGVPDGRHPGRLAQEPPGALLQPRQLDTPDFAMIYAFLGSMFDPVCHMINHADVMQQMTPVDRETAALILANCVHNFNTPGFSNELLAQLRGQNKVRRQPPPMSYPGDMPGEPPREI